MAIGGKEKTRWDVDQSIITEVFEVIMRISVVSVKCSRTGKS